MPTVEAVSGIPTNAHMPASVGVKGTGIGEVRAVHREEADLEYVVYIVYRA
jgi:hypothetical protein